MEFNAELYRQFQHQDMIENEEYFDTYQSSGEKNLPYKYFDAEDIEENNVSLSLPEPLLHTVNSTKVARQPQCNAIPTVSQEAGLELLTPSDVQVNMAL